MCASNPDCKLFEHTAASSDCQINTVTPQLLAPSSDDASSSSRRVQVSSDLVGMTYIEIQTDPGERMPDSGAYLAVKFCTDATETMCCTSAYLDNGEPNNHNYGALDHFSATELGPCYGFLYE